MPARLLSFASTFFNPRILSQPIHLSNRCAITSIRRPTTNTTTTTTNIMSPSMAVSDLRVNYSKSTLDDSTLTASPFTLFDTWMKEATHACEAESNAMCLSTADKTGRPSARMVLLKAYDNRGFVWYTNYGSRKARQLSDTPFAALTFWWPSLERSVRIEGPVVRVSDEESDAYFQSRPPESQLGAWVSDQSQPIEQREKMESRWRQLHATHLDEYGKLKKKIERPQHWGGYRLVPELIEFWKGRSARLHDRVVYERELPEEHRSLHLSKDQWTTKRLQP